MQAVGTHPDLSWGLFSRNIQDTAAAVQLSQNLQQKGGFADARITPQKYQ